MVRNREIKKYAGMWVIKLTTTDAKDFNLKEGDEVDIEDMIIKKQGKKK